MTLDQIEDAQRGEDATWDRSPSLQQAARMVGSAFTQCPDCRGNGYTGARLMVSRRDMWALAKHNPTGEIPIQRERCIRCDGAGGWVTK